VQDRVFWCRINVMLSDAVEVVNGLVKKILGIDDFLVGVDNNLPLVFLAIGRQEDYSKVLGKTYYCRNIFVEFHRVHWLGLYD
jgi:hypothetical protein